MHRAQLRTVLEYALPELLPRRCGLPSIRCGNFESTPQIRREGYRVSNDPPRVVIIEKLRSYGSERIVVFNWSPVASPPSGALMVLGEREVPVPPPACFAFPAGFATGSGIHDVDPNCGYNLNTHHLRVSWDKPTTLLGFRR